MRAKRDEEEREWRWSDDKMYVDRLRGAEWKILNTRSVHHHLEPKIFPSGPTFQLTGTCHKALTFADRICLWPFSSSFAICDASPECRACWNHIVALVASDAKSSTQFIPITLNCAISRDWYWTTESGCDREIASVTLLIQLRKYYIYQLSAAFVWYKSSRGF